MANSPELQTIASDPISRNMLVTPTLSRVLNATNGVVSALCNEASQCFPNPCSNGGLCYQDVGIYYCQCKTGFSGYNCTRTCSKQVDVVFLIDISGSLDSIFDTDISLSRTIAYGLDIDSGNARVGAMTFSSQVQGQFYLNSYVGSRQSVITAMAFYDYSGSTNIAAALNEARSNHFLAANGARSGVAKVAILITDGYATVNPDQVIPAATALKNTGVELYVIATGESPNLSVLQSVASSPTSKYLLSLPDASYVVSTSNTLLDRACAQ